MSESHPDITSYNIIWDKIINAEIKNYQSLYVNCIELIPNIKEEIWQQYVSLNNYCKANYMKSSTGKIDRHKVAACYMIAIENLQPMKLTTTINNYEIPLAINEMLAITVGLSLVRAFTIAAIIENKDLSDEDRKALISQFDSGLKTPDGNLINHGNYFNNFANEIHFAWTEGKLNILALAHELYLLEVITKLDK